MPQIIMTSSGSTENYSEQYKIQLCQTLETKTKIRECLKQRATEYNQEQWFGVTIIGFIIFAIFVWMFIKDKF